MNTPDIVRRGLGLVTAPLSYHLWWRLRLAFALGVALVWTKRDFNFPGGKQRVIQTNDIIRFVDHEAQKHQEAQ